jgi:WD40 repeat protein
LKPPGFNPCAYQVKTWFQAFAFNATRTATVWAADTGAEIARLDTLQFKNHNAAVSPDGRLIAVATFSAEVKIWEVLRSKQGQGCALFTTLLLCVKTHSTDDSRYGPCNPSDTRE